MGDTTIAVAKGSEAVTAIVNLVRDIWGIDVKKERDIAQAKADAIGIIAQAEIQAETEQFIARTKQRLFLQEISRQANLETILAKSLPEMSEEVNPKNLNQDFLHRFAIEAQDVSEDELQKLFAKALAQEAKAPNSISNRTLEMMHSLSRSDAFLIQNLSALVFQVGVTPAVIVPKEMKNKPWFYTLSYEQMMHLDDVGVLNHRELIIGIPASSNIEFKYFADEMVYQNPKQADVKVNIHTLTWDGAAIVKIAGGNKHEQYLGDVKKYLEVIGLKRFDLSESTSSNPSEVQFGSGRLA